MPTKITGVQFNDGEVYEAGTYSKPSGGIPKTDLASDVQASLGKADTALQTAPVTSVNNKTGAVTLTASDVGALPDDTVIPSQIGQLADNVGLVHYNSQTLTDAQKAQARTNIGAASMSDIPSLAAYRTASAQDAIDAAQNTAIAAKYTKPSTGIPKTDLASDVKASLSKADTALQEHQSLASYRTASAQDEIDNAQNVEIRKKANSADLAAVATSGSYNDLADKPSIPSLAGYATEAWVNNKGYLTLADLPVYNGGVS